MNLPDWVAVVGSIMVFYGSWLGISTLYKMIYQNNKVILPALVGVFLMGFASSSVVVAWINYL